MQNNKIQKDEIDLIDDELSYETGKRVRPYKAIRKLAMGGIMGVGKLVLVVTTVFTCYFVLSTEWNNMLPKLCIVPQTALAVAITVRTFIEASLNNLTKGEK